MTYWLTGFQKNIIDYAQNQLKLSLDLSCIVYRSNIGYYTIDDFKNRFADLEYNHNRVISKEEVVLNELNGENDWDDLSCNCILSEDIIDEFKDKVNWDLICIYQTLSSEFMDKHKEYLFWTNISKYQKLSNTFINKYHKRLNWNFISAYQELSFRMIEKYANKINYKYIRQNKFISRVTLNKYRNKIMSSNSKFLSNNSVKSNYNFYYNKNKRSY